MFWQRLQRLLRGPRCGYSFRSVPQSSQRQLYDRSGKISTTAIAREESYAALVTRFKGRAAPRNRIDLSLIPLALKFGLGLRGGEQGCRATAIGMRNCACRLFSMIRGVTPAAVIREVSRIALKRAAPACWTAFLREARKRVTDQLLGQAFGRSRKLPDCEIPSVIASFRPRSILCWGACLAAQEGADSFGKKYLRSIGLFEEPPPHPRMHGHSARGSRTRRR